MQQTRTFHRLEKVRVYSQYMNGYEEGYYNIVVTQYEPDDLQVYLNSNEVVYDKKRMNGKHQVGSGRIVTVTHDTPFIEDIVPQDGKKSQEKNSNKDSNGKKLSTGQQEYFNDSVVRNEDGNLLVVYHGTPNKNVDVFSYDYVGSVGGSNHGYGFYFTDNKKDATLYAQGIGEIKETYINIPNAM